MTNLEHKYIQTTIQLINTKRKQENMDNFIKNIVKIITAKCEDNKFYPCENNTMFVSSKIPSITIHQYLTYLLSKTDSCEACYRYVGYHLVNTCMNIFNINYYSIHRIILTTFVICVKFLTDGEIPLSLFAKIGGVAVNELKDYELHWLIHTDFNIMIPPECLFEFFNQFNVEYTDVTAITKNEDSIYEKTLDNNKTEEHQGYEEKQISTLNKNKRKFEKIQTPILNNCASFAIFV